MKKELKELYFKGHLDCLYFYSKHIKDISKFISKQEIASKIHVLGGQFLRRGSKDPPLFIKELSNKELNPKFFELRIKMKRAEAIEKNLLTKTQEKIWLYFPPNKPVEFFYATNGEHPNKPIERIFIDIDRTNLTTEKAKIVAKALVTEIKSDKQFNKLLKYEIKVIFTGSSYHVYLFLNKPITHDFYEKYIAYSRNEKIPSFITKWAKSITKKTKIPATGGHERKQDIIILDPSGTPSGKLARVPFSVHVKDDKIDAIAELVSLELSVS
jgi:hypothetical protein